MGSLATVLRGIPFKSAVRAHEYFNQALVKEDYWSKGAEIAGMWHGKFAEKLGLRGEVRAEDFEALVNNKHPEWHEEAGETVTVRNQKNRVVGMDMSFGVPKSVSILYALTGDQRILDVLAMANQKMMESIERDAKTQLWGKGKNADLVSGNIAYATFTHHTSRPVNGMPAPHLHTHNFIMNMTFLAENGRVQALKWRNFKQNAPFHEAVGRSWLAKGMAELGYPVQKVNKAFEIAGIPRAMIQKYSPRTMQIEAIIAEKGIKDAVSKSQVGALSRESKTGNMSAQETVAAWAAWAADDEKQIVRELQLGQRKEVTKTVTSAQAVDYALEHCFEKKSVIKIQDLFREAIAYGYGSVTDVEILPEIQKRDLITGEIKGVAYCTVPSLLSEEQQIMNFVRRGKGRFLALHRGEEYQVKRDFFSAEQRLAVREILASRNQVIGLQGSPGVGKTTLMKEVVEAIELDGGKVFAFAPLNRAVKTLKDDGYSQAKTLQSLLANPEQQAAVKGHVIWVDEAGLVGDEDLANLFRIAGANTRVLLSGDIYQHSPVSRGEPFRLLQQYDVLRCSKVTTIIRQEEGYYRDAAQALANGDVEAAFGYLQAMGAIREMPDNHSRYNQLAVDYVEKLDSGESPLLISPTHAEGGKVVAALRNHLQRVKKLGADQTLERLADLDWSEPQKQRVELYQEGQVIKFHQNIKGGIIRGTRFLVQGHDENGEVIIADQKGKRRVLDLSVAKWFTVYRKREIALAKGEKIRMTAGGRFTDGSRFNNGQTYEIARIYPSGSIKFKNGSLMKCVHGHHLNYGYISTSVATQSATEDSTTFIAQDSQSSAANSLNQFLVSSTRGRSRILLYTDNTDELQKAVKSLKQKVSSTEFTLEHAPDRMPESSSNDGKIPYDVTDKERAAMFNEKGEFRYTPGSIRHDIGGAGFAEYVKARREKNEAMVGLQRPRKVDESKFVSQTEKSSPQLFKERKAQLVGQSNNFSAEVEKKKVGWADELNAKRGIKAIGSKNEGKSVGQPSKKDLLQNRSKEEKVGWNKGFETRRNQLIAEARKKPSLQPAADAVVAKVRAKKLSEAADQKYKLNAKVDKVRGAFVDKAITELDSDKRKSAKVTASGNRLSSFLGKAKKAVAEKIEKVKGDKAPAKSEAKEDTAKAKGKNKGKGKSVAPPKKVQPPPVIIVRRK